MKTENVTDINDYKENRVRKKTKRKKYMFIVTIIILAVFCYLYYNKGIYSFNIPNLSFKQKEAAQTSTITFDSYSRYKFGLYKEKVLFCSRDGIKCVNKNGETEWNIAFTFSNPYIQTTDKYVLIADRGEKKLKVITNYRIISEVQTNEPIITTKINESGYFAVVTEEKGYKGQIIIYNPSGQEIYRIHSVDYITDVDISSDNTRIAVSTVNTNKGKVCAGIKFYDINMEAPYAGTEIDNTLISFIKFNKKDKLVLVGDTGTFIYNCDGQKQGEFIYGEKELVTYNVNSPDIIVLALKDEKKSGLLNYKSILKVINFEGKEKWEIEVDGEIKHIDVQDRMICINKGREIKIFSEEGREIYNITVTKDIKDLFLLKSKKEVLVVSRSALDVIQLRK